MSLLVETRGLGYQYVPGAWALRNINLRIHAGDRLAVLGANGAGKSTLLLALAGVLHPTEGQLIWKGEPVRTRTSRSCLREKIGLLLQDPEDQHFAPTVEQDVAFGLVQRGMPNHAAFDRAHSVLDLLRISHLAGRQVHQLSMGEQKRVALAGLLAVRPDLLLLDEPTAGLDCHGSRALLDSLCRLHADGVAILLATHDSNLAAQWARRVAIMDGGAIVAEGETQEILSDRALMEKARISTPLTYAAAALFQKLCQPSEPWTLPTTAFELEEFIRRVVEQARHHASGAK
jgi:cobalt/nickel transport system ATP-binding protein